MSAASAVRFGVLALLWGSNFLLIAVALQTYSPGGILAGRLALGALVLLVALRVRRGALPTDIATWGHLGAASLVATVIPYYLFAWAEQTIPSSGAGVLNATTPLFTFALASVSLREGRPSTARLTGLVLGFVGVVLILQPWAAASGGQLPGQIGALGASISYAVAYVYQRRYLTNRGIAALTLATGQMIVAAVITLPWLLDLRASLALDRSTLSLLALGALGTGVAYVLNYQLIQDEGPTTASTVTYLLPVVAAALGVLVLSEEITVFTVVGAVVVLLGTALAQGRLRSASRGRQ